MKLHTAKDDVKLIVYDFDGVLTDNHVWVSQDGAEAVSCNRGDGWWIGQIKKLGVDQLILSTEKNPVVTARGNKIGLETIQGQSDKKQALLEIIGRKKVELANVLYIGNDMNDADCMRAVGFPMAPKDSHAEILKMAKLVFPVGGGQGLVQHLYTWLTAHPEKHSLAHGAQIEPTGDWGKKIADTMAESVRVKQALMADRETSALIEKMGTTCSAALKKGRKIIFAGNGGSFADSMHLAAEFVSKLQIDRQPLASLALGCGNSNLTAIGNDYGYEHVFEREIYALAVEGDVFIAISTSGNSPNILKAVTAAKERGLHIFGWSGQTGGKLAAECPTIKVPSKETARIQECHILIGHILCEIAEAPFLPA